MPYFYGLLLGLTLQISIGPIFFAILHKSLRESFSEAFKMVWGVTLVDALYIILSFTGIAVLLQVEVLRAVILAAGSGVLVFFGLTYYRNARRRRDLEQAAAGEPGGAKSFWYGVKLTAVNPLTVLFWSGTFGSLAASGTVKDSGELLLYAAGCLSATVLFLSLLSIMGRLLAPHVTVRFMRGADYLVGTVLIGFGIVMFARLFI